METNPNCSHIYKITPFLNEYIRYSRWVILCVMLNKIPIDSQSSIAKYKLVQEDVKTICKVVEREEEVWQAIITAGTKILKIL